LKYLVKSGTTGCTSEGRTAFRDAGFRRAEGKRFLLEAGTDCAELTRGAIESLDRAGLMLFHIF
jgi:hypothetical protein